MLIGEATDFQMTLAAQVRQFGVHGHAETFRADVIKEGHEPEQGLLIGLRIEGAAVAMERLLGIAPLAFPGEQGAGMFAMIASGGHELVQHERALSLGSLGITFA